MQNPYIDTHIGASTNLVGSQTLDWLKRERIEVASSKPQTEKKLHGYGSEQPIPIRGTVNCKASVRSKTTSADFMVIQGKGPALRGRNTAIELGVLHIGIIGSVRSEEKVPNELLQRYPKVFQGIGKLKDQQVKIHINEGVTPVAQPLRRTPFQLKAKVEKKIQELLDLDIIEHAVGPTPWVNPMVVVPKPGGDDIRLCMDTCRANEAIEGECHPIPTTDEILQTMNGSKMFSKLDLKWGTIRLNKKKTPVTHNLLYKCGSVPI